MTTLLIASLLLTAPTTDRTNLTEAKAPPALILSLSRPATTPLRPTTGVMPRLLLAPASKPASMSRGRDGQWNTRSVSPRRSTARRIVGGIAGTVGGFFLGGYAGAAIEGDSCGCDDPGLKGFIIGAPIGAILGGILGAHWK
jgi:hypothetical protein